MSVYAKAVPQPVFRIAGPCLNSPAHHRGFSLVELMIALALGLIVILGAVTVFLSNKESYRTNVALGQVQENARVAFDLIARDVRQAGLTGCGNLGRVGNLLNNGTAAGGTVAWYADFGNAIRGYDSGVADPAVASGSSSAQRVSTTSSLMLIGAALSGTSIANYDASTYTFTLTGGNPGIQAGDLVIVCDPDHAVIGQVTSIAGGALVMNTGTSAPGNCSRGLGFPTLCTSTGNPYAYVRNSQIALMSANDWYVGVNPIGGRSLYRRTLVNVAGEPTPTSQEMVRNVTDMQLTYHAVGGTGFVTAAAITNWAEVDAIRMVLTFQGSERRTGTDAQPITRQMTATVKLRNR